MENLNLKEKEAIIKKANESIINDPLISKYIYKDTWMSGSSTTVYPSTVYVNDGRIEIQLTAKRNVFDKCIERILKNSDGVLIKGYYCKKDGSCPNTVCFWTNWSVFAKYVNR